MNSGMCGAGMHSVFNLFWHMTLLCVWVLSCYKKKTKIQQNLQFRYVSAQQATVETFDDRTTWAHYDISEYGGGGGHAAVSAASQVALEGCSIPTALWLAAADNSGCLSDCTSSARCLVRLLCVGNSFARGSVRLRHSRERSGNCGRPLCM